MIDHIHKCIFIHIPRCAGGYIKKTLDPAYKMELKKEVNRRQLCHATASDLQNLGSQFDEYYKFAMVRNPFERLVSAYIYYMKREKMQDSFSNFVLREGQFGEALFNAGQFSPAGILVNLRPMVDFLYDENGKILVDFVGRYESFQTDFTHIRSVLKITGARRRRHIHKTKHFRWRWYYDTRLLKIVRERYKDDFLKFGYGK